MKTSLFNTPVSTPLFLAAIAGVFCVGLALAEGVKTPESRGTANPLSAATGKASESPSSLDAPQRRNEKQFRT
jgi:hypothetical protein